MQYIDLEKVIWNEVEGSVILLQFSTGAFFVLNDVGSKLWKLLDRGRTPDEIVTELQKLYTISKERMEQDIADFIKDATAKGLLSDGAPVAQASSHGAPGGNEAGAAKGEIKPYEKPAFMEYSSAFMDSFAY